MAKATPTAQPQPAVQKREPAERAPELNKFVAAKAVGKGEVQAYLMAPRSYDDSLKFITFSALLQCLQFWSVRRDAFAKLEAAYVL